MFGLATAVAMALLFLTEDIGVYAIFWGKLMVFSTFACLRYELAFFSIRSSYKKNIHLVSCLILLALTSLLFLGINGLFEGFFDVYLFIGALFIGLKSSFHCLHKLQNGKMIW